MKVILANGTELEPILVTGERRIVQGASRDSLSFVFPEDAGLDAMDALFTADNCESITIVESEDASYIHKGYTIRAELSLKAFEVAPETAETGALYENRITVAMAERTYVESQMAAMQAAIEMLCMEDAE